MSNQINKKKGFTLVEILVSISIFIIVITTVSGILVSSVKNQKRSLASQELLNQTSYVLEYMSRALRMAKKDDLDDVHCLLGDKVNYEITTSGLGGIKFRNYKDECQEFYIGNDLVLYENRTGYTEPLPFTSVNIKINSFEIKLSGEEQPSADELQPKVTLLLDVEAVEGNPPPKLRIQTTVSQRDLDVEE